MDVFEKVMEIRPEVDGVDDNLAAARMRLMTELRAAGDPVRSRSAGRWFLAAGVTGAVAAAIVGVIVVGSIGAPTPAVVGHPTLATARPSSPTPVTTLPPAKGAPETPQSVLSAASSAATLGGLSAQTGEYLRVTWTSDVLFLGDGSSISQPGYNVSYSTAARAWVVRTSGAFYIPADVRGDWYFAPSSAPTVTSAFGQDSAADAQMQLYLDRWTAALPGGSFAAGGDALPEGDGTLRGDFLTSLPTSADGVLAWFRDRQIDTDYHHHAVVGWTLMSLLACNAGTGEVRAAMLQALGNLGGASIVESRGTLRTVAFDSTLGGEAGQAGDIRRHQTITVDVSTGRVSAISDSTNPGGSVVPDEIADVRRNYEVALVDGLPG